MEEREERPSNSVFLEQYLDGTLSLRNAADILSDDTCNPYGTWSTIIYRAAEGSDQDVHHALAELIKAIVAQAKPGWSSEEDHHYGWVWRDIHDSLWSQYHDARAAECEATRQWVNFNAFTAACLGANVDSGDAFAFGIIIQALEKKLGKTATTNHGDRLTHRTNIDIAATYFILGSRALLDLDSDCSEDVCFEDGVELWKGRRGASPERWEFWRQRWEILAQSKDLSDELREAARWAEVSMGNAERKRDKDRRNKKKRQW